MTAQFLSTPDGILLHVHTWRKPMKDSYGRMGIGMAWGVGIGAALGTAMDNVPLWISLGTAIGAAVGATFSQGQR